jgi:purine-binding chemotaxis protein CheW
VIDVFDPSASTDAPPQDAAEEFFYLPSPDFWREELPQVRGQRYLAFDLGETTFGMPLANVREVDRIPTITPVPNTPAWLLGAANLRGQICSVVDLAGFLEINQDHPPRDARLVLTRAGSMEMSLLIDRLRDIRELPDGAIRLPSSRIPDRVARYLSGVCAGDGRLTLILDTPRLLHSPEICRFD